MPTVLVVTGIHHNVHWVRTIWNVPFSWVKLQSDKQTFYVDWHLMTKIKLYKRNFCYHQGSNDNSRNDTNLLWCTNVQHYCNVWKWPSQPSCLHHYGHCCNNISTIIHCDPFSWSYCTVVRFLSDYTKSHWLMKTHTFIHQMSCKMNRKYSQDIEEVRNNDFYLK